MSKTVENMFATKPKRKAKNGLEPDAEELKRYIHDELIKKFIKGGAKDVKAQ